MEVVFTSTTSYLSNMGDEDTAEKKLIHLAAKASMQFEAQIIPEYDGTTDIVEWMMRDL